MSVATAIMAVATATPKRDRDSSQQFAPLLPPKRFVEEAREHNLRLEHAASRRYVRFLDDDGVAGGFGLEWNRIAAARHAH